MHSLNWVAMNEKRAKDIRYWCIVYCLHHPITQCFINKAQKAPIIAILCTAFYICRKVTICPAEWCGQGFHQTCLVKKTGGMSTLPELPGSLHWLCNSCTPYFDLATKVGQGGRTKPARKKNSLPDTSSVSAEASAAPDPSPSATSTRWIYNGVTAN